MAEIYFSLGDLFQEAFGYKSQAFQPNVKNIKGDKDVTRTKIFSDWCRFAGITFNNAAQRESRGWPMERIFNVRLE